MVALLGVRRSGWISASLAGSRPARPRDTYILACPSSVMRAVVMMPAQAPIRPLQDCKAVG